MNQARESKARRTAIIVCTLALSATLAGCAPQGAGEPAGNAAPATNDTAVEIGRAHV